MKPFRGRILTAVLIFVLLVTPAVVLAYLEFQLTSNHLTALATQRQSDIAKLGALMLRERFDRMIDLDASFADRSRVREGVASGDWAAAIAAVETSPEEFSYIEQVQLFDPSGMLRADSSSTTAALGTDFSSTDWFKDFQKDWRPRVSDMFLSQVPPKENVILVLAPVRNALDKSVIGILAMRVSVETISKWTKELSFGPDGLVEFSDHDGFGLVASTNGQEPTLADFSKDPAVMKALAGQSGFDTLPSPDGRGTRLVAYAPVEGHGWTVSAAQQATSAFADRASTLSGILSRDALFLLLYVVGALTIVKLLRDLERRDLLERTFLASVGEGIVTTDAEGKIVLLNAAGSQMLHAVPEEAIGLAWIEFASDARDLEDRPIPIDERPFERARRGETASASLRLTRADGSSFPARVTASPVIMDGRIVGVIEVLRDITREIELERERNEVLSIATHQLRAPLAAMRWTTEMLLDESMGPLSAERREQVGVLAENVKGLLALLNDMLDVSRREAGKMRVNSAPTDMVSLLKALVEQVMPLAKQRRQTLVTHLPGAFPMMEIDRKLISQAVMNLLSNAIKYTQRGGKVTLALERRGDDASIEVSDDGTGIPLDQQKNVFQKFFRAENAVASGAEGTGLGLYLVKQIVELSGGTVTFISKPGKGTSFFVTIPLIAPKGHKA